MKWAKRIGIGLVFLFAVLAALLSSRAGISGRLNGKPAISANATAPEQLALALCVEAPFQLHSGVLRGVDSRKAATNLLLKDSSGETRFGQLSGLPGDGSAARTASAISRWSSGALSAGRQCHHCRQQSVVRARSMRKSARGRSPAATVPLNVTGTLDAPLLLPTGAVPRGRRRRHGRTRTGGRKHSVGAKVGTWVGGSIWRYER